MIINRAWAMPNKWTFTIKPIKELIERYMGDGLTFIDPFSGKHSPAYITNDLDPDMPAEYNIDALEFLRIFDSGTINGVLFDPPYSPRQVSECYKKLGKEVNMQTTQSSFWGKCKEAISNLMELNGIVITCGWNSGGIGKKYGFEIIEILLVAHGGWHNDTIVTVERKIK